MEEEIIEEEEEEDYYVLLPGMIRLVETPKGGTKKKRKIVRRSGVNQYGEGEGVTGYG